MAIEALIREAIEDKGYINIADMMKISLTSNLASYYRSKQPLGSKGDFITSPEISQMFGEMIGVWCADLWLKLGKPQKINLVELGPGRGLLMKDLLRSTRHVPGFHESLTIEFIEVSKALTALQQEALKDYLAQITWHTEIKNIRLKPTIFIANEFFDALPIRQFIKEKNMWYERILSCDPFSKALYFNRLPLSEALEQQLNYEHPKALDGAIVEESLEAIQHIQFISEHLWSNGGGALVIDYGYDIPPKKRKSNQYNSTLQALKNHKYHSILETLGEADLSAHVNFHNLKMVAEVRSLHNFGTITQKDFLKNMGIELRLNLLKQNLPIAEQELLEKQVKRLIDPTQMGDLFRTLMIISDPKLTPAGI